MTNLICSLCERKIPDKKLSLKHHLTPKHKGGKKSTTVLMCHACGNMVHKLFSNHELKHQFNSIEALKNDERVQRYVTWIRKNGKFKICLKAKKKKN
jgi:hypothetical protein